MSIALSCPTASRQPALPGIDLNSRSVDAALRDPGIARERLERVPVELDHRRVVDRDHVHWGLVVVLELPARAALRVGRAVDCMRDERDESVS